MNESMVKIIVKNAMSHEDDEQSILSWQNMDYYYYYYYKFDIHSDGLPTRTHIQ